MKLYKYTILDNTEPGSMYTLQVCFYVCLPFNFKSIPSDNIDKIYIYLSFSGKLMEVYSTRENHFTEGNQDRFGETASQV